MYKSIIEIETNQNLNYPRFNRFELEHQPLIQHYIDQYRPASCEYNFANLFTWQDAYQLRWTLYQGRLLVYDKISNCAFMPIGEDLAPEELVILSLNLKTLGLSPNFSLTTMDYLEKYPEISTYFKIVNERDQAEYIYRVEDLIKLNGSKLHKKRNLISQFIRKYSQYKIHNLNDGYRTKALQFTKERIERRSSESATLNKEFLAIKTAFETFEDLNLEGLVLTINDAIVAYSVFSRLDSTTYDIQFEKADPTIKGAAQVINQETAKFLENDCIYLNREQDLGIKGLRQAKMSYNPEKLIAMNSLIFHPVN